MSFTIFLRIFAKMRRFSFSIIEIQLDENKNKTVQQLFEKYPQYVGSKIARNTTFLKMDDVLSELETLNLFSD